MSQSSADYFSISESASARHRILLRGEKGTSLSPETFVGGKRANPKKSQRIRRKEQNLDYFSISESAARHRILLRGEVGDPCHCLLKRLPLLGGKGNFRLCKEKLQIRGNFQRLSSVIELETEQA